jgi:hypothetical protein
VFVHKTIFSVGNYPKIFASTPNFAAIFHENHIRQCQICLLLAVWPGAYGTKLLKSHERIRTAI